MKVSASLERNMEYCRSVFSDCGDLVSRRLELAPGFSVFLMYVDNLVDRQGIERHVITPLLGAFSGGASSSAEDAFAVIMDAVLTLEVTKETELDGVFEAVLSGDTALFAEGSAEAMMISAKGFASRGVPEATTEATVMGSKEAFCEVMRTNTALVRRRIRDTRLKVRQLKAGRRSRTDIAVMYMEDVVRPQILEETVRLIEGIDVDAVTDSGMLEQFIETRWRSPFPQFETTERPDKAAASILEGRIAVIVDNSPFALILPATLNTLYQSSEDYYQRFEIVSLTRALRFIAGILAVALPGFYVATAVYHPSMLPSMLLLKMTAARQNVPFPAVIEVLLMEASFELLREAGVRMPRAVGGTLGIVGGLIIGQAAVEAGIVSPIVVVVVAMTAIASFAIPFNTLASGYRLVKFAVIACSAVLGYLGFWAALLVTLIHLASLQSFGVPYLFPFVSGDVNHYRDMKDSVIRFPLTAMKNRPFFARPGADIRMRVRKK